jgi:hypothetical protein
MRTLLAALLVGVSAVTIAILVEPTEPAAAYATIGAQWDGPQVPVVEDTMAVRSVGGPALPANPRIDVGTALYGYLQMRAPDRSGDAQGPGPLPIPQPAAEPSLSLR